MSNTRNFTQTTIINDVIVKVENSIREIGETIMTNCLCSGCWKKITLVSEFVALNERDGAFVRKSGSCKCKEK
jgi:hypothetical protein